MYGNITLNNYGLSPAIINFFSGNSIGNVHQTMKIRQMFQNMNPLIQEKT